MKKILCLIAVALTSFDLTAQNFDNVYGHNDAPDTLPVQSAPVVVSQPVKFGYLSYQQVLETLDGYADVQKTIAGLRQAYEQELARSEEIFSKQFAEYVEGQKTFPDNIRLKRQKELQQTMEESLQFKQEAKDLLQKKENEVVGRLRERLNRAISELASERGYAFVLNIDNNSFPFVNGAMGEDITNELLNRLNTK
jgi:outer membrane protein